MESFGKTRHPSITQQAQESADRINELLPVKLRASDADKYPELLKLLHSLTRHINEDGVSGHVQKDQVEASETLRHNKHAWLQYHILYTELQQLLLEYDLQELSTTQTDAQVQYHTAVQESLNLSEIVDYLNCNPDPDSSATLLGLSADDLDRHNPHKKHIKSIQLKLIPDIEDHLRRKCENLVYFHTPVSQLENEKFTFAKASQLPTILEAEKKSLKEESINLKRAQKRREKQFWQYYQALTDSLHTMEELVMKHLLKSETERDEITSEWLAARCDALCLKLKLVQLQILCMTYTEDTVSALKMISKHLDKAKVDIHKELMQTSQILKSYQAFGSDFEAIAQEYSHLQQEIEKQQWAMKELN